MTVAFSVRFGTLGSSAMNNYAYSLAELVHKELLREREISPPIATLFRLFETMYLASLRREESTPISCRIAYISKSRPDPDPPERIVADRWCWTPLRKEIPLTVDNLVKLSEAVDPWASTLAVHGGSGRSLYIWGLVDQTVHWNRFVVGEAESGPEMPGMFQASIQGTGEISVFKAYRLLGSLNKSTIIRTQHDVLRRGPVRKKLESSLETFLQSVRRRVPQKTYSLRGHWDLSLAESWIDVLSRILIHIQHYGHGGAILLGAAGFGGLNRKYLVRYGRLSKALVRHGALLVQNTSYSDEISEKYLDRDADDIPALLYLDEEVSGNELRDTKDEITGCVRFISSLSRVDGLILFDSNLVLQGFGVEITEAAEPRRVFLAESITGHKKKAISYNHYGTRHRSMMRYCSRHEDSVGFVVSQDGDIRVITRVGSDVLVWENVKVRYAE
jgi:hypothetical protein